MAKLNRETLKNFFKKGQLPSENHFKDLIDSSVNAIDDGLAKSVEDGLALSSQVGSKSLMSFYENIADLRPEWRLILNKDDENKGLSIQDRTGITRLFFKNNGNIGINTEHPEQPLSVNGFIGMKGRIGIHKYGQVYGDGNWHNILEGLDSIQAFEIVARIDGLPKMGKYAITHAIAMSTYGKSHPIIKWVQGGGAISTNKAWFGWRRNRIQLRWHGDTHNYALQIRTRTHYGLNENNHPSMIKYHISQLWDESFFDEEKNSLKSNTKNEDKNGKEKA